MEKRLLAFVVAFRTNQHDQGSFDEHRSAIVSYTIDAGGPMPKSDHYDIEVSPDTTIREVWTTNLARVKEQEGVA
jgi:hypothetical protein